MSTVIGATGSDLLLPAAERDLPPAPVFGAPADQPLDEALETAWSALRSAGHLVVVAPTGLPAAHLARLRAVRSLLEGDRMALVDVDLPPLALALLIEQLRRIAPYDLGPGVLASAARLLAHYLHAGAVLGSVARLDRVRVGLGSHLTSLLPGARFAVLATPEPSLTRLAPDTRLPGPGYPTRLAVAVPGHPHASPGPAPGEEWVTGRLAADWHCPPARRVPLPQDSPHWWGTGRLVEFTAYLADVGVLYQLVRSAHRTSCRWCGLEHVGDTCGFCNTAPGDTGPPRAPHGTARPAG